MRTAPHSLVIASAALFCLACSEAQVASSHAPAAEADASWDAPASPVAPDARPDPAAPGGVQLKRFQIVDPSGFERPIVAFQVLAPADWKLEGGIRWNPNYRCSVDMVSISARLVSPDGRKAFELFPLYMTQWTDDDMARSFQIQAVQSGGQGCNVARPWNTQQFVGQFLIPGFRPGARVVDARERPEAARALYAESMQKLGNSARIDVDSARVRIEYDGQEEWISGSTLSMTMSMPSMSAAAMGQMGNSVFQSTYSDKVYGFRAPKGELDAHEALFERMIASVQVNPAWQQKINRTHSNINRINAKGAQDRAAITRKTNNEIMQMQQDSWQRRQESNDRGHREVIESIRGTETYDDPSTGNQWELESGYDQVWKNGSDEFIYSNNPNYDPNVETNGNWNELPVAP